MSTSRQSAMTAFPARLTDAEWAVLRPLIPANRPGGRPPKHTRRSVLDAILCVARQGVTWRVPPEGLPHWSTPSWCFQQWQKDGTWTRVEDALRKAVRLAEGRASATPPAGVVASQTVEATGQPGPRGFDGRDAKARQDEQGVTIPTGTYAKPGHGFAPGRHAAHHLQPPVRPTPPDTPTGHFR